VFGHAREFHDWVLLQRARRVPKLADEREVNGDKETFRVKYWGVGNESWGCGGDISRRIRHAYRQFVTQFPVYLTPFLVATARAGTHGYGSGWTNGFFEAMQGAIQPG